MASSAPTLATRWEPLPPRVVAELLGPSSARWWLSGGVALDHWLGTYTREHGNIDASTTFADLPQLLQDLPAPFSAWAPGDGVLPWAEADMVPICSRSVFMTTRRAHGYCRSTSRTARIASGFTDEIPDSNCRGIVQCGHGFRQHQHYSAPADS